MMVFDHLNSYQRPNHPQPQPGSARPATGARPAAFLTRHLGLAALAGFLAVAGVGRAAFGERITVANGEFHAGPERIWINGANTPWHTWNDFGGNFDAAWWDAHFRALHDNGINATRIWITCDGEVGIEIDREGRVSGATEKHWRDLDELFRIARAHQVYVMATLMSFDHFKNSHPGHERWRRWIGSDTNIDSYVANYVVPFVQRYGNNPFLWSIDLMNEPDWVHEAAEDGRFPWVRLQSYFARAAVAIHEHSPVLVTVGLAMPKYNSDRPPAEGNTVSDRALQAALNRPGARLDFYASHFYDWITPIWGPAPYLTPAEYRLPTDKPAVLGEMPAKGTAGHTTAGDYESAFAHGWQGAMAWTSNGVDENGDLKQLGPATRAFRDRHPQLVFPPASGTEAGR